MNRFNPLEDKRFEEWWFDLPCSHCKKRDYDFFDEEGRPLCEKCYNKLLHRKEKRQMRNFKHALDREKEKIRRKEARQFYEILAGSGLLKDYQIGFVILD